jgi:hypothetical protein
MSQPIYHVQVYDFVDPSSGDFSPGDLVAEFELQKNLGYSHNINDIGRMFFTINQDDPKASILDAAVNQRKLAMLYRDDTNVWSGWLGEADETHLDAIIYAYDFASGYYDLQSDWDAEWTDAQIDTIVGDLVDYAAAKTGSRVAWLTKGTIEAPVTTSGGSTPYVQGLYKLYYKRLLFALQELTAAAISDTTNKVQFEITPDGTFNFYKDQGDVLTTNAFTWGNPQLLAYHRMRHPVLRRNKILSVGSTALDVAMRATQANSSDITAYGLSEEPIYLQFVRDADELARVGKLRLARARRFDSDIMFTFAPGAITPFRASGQSYKLGDLVSVTISRGMTNIAAEQKVIVGQQVIQYKGAEIVRPILSERL